MQRNKSAGHTIVQRKSRAGMTKRAVELGPADRKVLRSLTAATAGDEEECSAVAREFAEYVGSVRSPTTANVYQRQFRRLFRTHKKTFSAMASKEFAGVLRSADKSSMRMFGFFWNRTQAEAAAPGRILQSSAKLSETTIARRGTLRPLRTKTSSSKGGREEASELVERDLQDFLDHLGREGKQDSSAAYGSALRTLAHLHRMSLDTMATQEYLDRVRALQWNKTFVEAVMLLCKFRRVVLRATSAWEASLHAFLDHVQGEMGQTTADRYGLALRRLACCQKLPLESMASQKYLDKVRKLNWQGEYAASVASLCRFRGVEVSDQCSLEVTEARKRKSTHVDDKENVCDKTLGFKRDLQPFLDHLHSEDRRATAQAYGMALRKLARLHRKSLGGMASQEYLGKVRKLNLPGKYAAAVASLCKFQGIAPAAQCVSTQRVVAQRVAAQRVAAQRVAAVEQTADSQGLQRLLDHLHSETGHATVVQYGQALRKLARVHGKSLDVMASKEYLDKVRRLNWNPKYSAAVRALCRFHSAPLSQREQVSAGAQKRLADAQARSHPVSDSDVLEVLRLLPFAQNTTRRNVMPKDAEWVHSTTLGVIGDYSHNTAVISNATVGCEDLVRLLCRWMENQLGVGFGAEACLPVTSITINKGYAAARHRDKNNLGPSALRAVGDCRGGLLRYWPTADAGASMDALRDEDSVLLDPKHKVVLFDGNFPHAVTPFDGERYSVVFFTSARYKQAVPECRAEARQMGLRWPTANLLASAKARVAEH